MAIIIFTDAVSYLVCHKCDATWEDSELYRCDSCGEVVCDECLAIPADDDCPNEFCKDCAAGWEVRAEE